MLQPQRTPHPRQPARAGPGSLALIVPTQENEQKTCRHVKVEVWKSLRERCRSHLDRHAGLTSRTVREQDAAHAMGRAGCRKMKAKPRSLSKKTRPMDQSVVKWAFIRSIFIKPLEPNGIKGFVVMKELHHIPSSSSYVNARVHSLSLSFSLLLSLSHTHHYY